MQCLESEAQVSSAGFSSASRLPWPRGPITRGHPFGKLLGEFLNEVRTQSGMSQTELAAALETTQPAISKLERARHMPSLGMLIRIAEVTRTPMVIKARLRYPGMFSDTLELWPLPQSISQWQDFEDLYP